MRSIKNYLVLMLIKIQMDVYRIFIGMQVLIGYFPTYSLGALTAAQFAYTLRKEIPNLDNDIEEGKFSILISWLRKNIHEKASFFSTNEVLEQVTKSPLNAKYFKEYITNRYL